MGALGGSLSAYDDRMLHRAWDEMHRHVYGFTADCRYFSVCGCFGEFSGQERIEPKLEGSLAHRVCWKMRVSQGVQIERENTKDTGSRAFPRKSELNPDLSSKVHYFQNRTIARAPNGENVYRVDER